MIEPLDPEALREEHGAGREWRHEVRPERDGAEQRRGTLLGAAGGAPRPHPPRPPHAIYGGALVRPRPRTPGRRRAESGRGPAGPGAVPASELARLRPAR